MTKKLTDKEKVEIYEEIERLRIQKSRWEWDDPFSDEPLYYSQRLSEIIGKIHKLQEKLNE